MTSSMSMSPYNFRCPACCAKARIALCYWELWSMDGKSGGWFGVLGLYLRPRLQSSVNLRV